MYSKILLFKAINEFDLARSKVFIVPNPILGGSSSWLIGKLIHIEDRGIFRVRGIHSPLPTWTYSENIGLLVTQETNCKKFEDLQELASKLWNSEEDAKFHIFLHKEKREANPGIVQEIFNVIKQNFVLAIVDPNPYIRHLAHCLPRE